MQIAHCFVSTYMNENAQCRGSTRRTHSSPAVMQPCSGCESAIRGYASAACSGRTWKVRSSSALHDSTQRSAFSSMDSQRHTNSTRAWHRLRAFGAWPAGWAGVGLKPGAVSCFKSQPSSPPWPAGCQHLWQSCRRLRPRRLPRCWCRRRGAPRSCACPRCRPAGRGLSAEGVDTFGQVFAEASARFLNGRPALACAPDADPGKNGEQPMGLEMAGKDQGPPHSAAHAGGASPCMPSMAWHPAASKQLDG